MSENNNGSTARTFLNVHQAAAMLGLSERTIRAWVFLHKINYYKIGRSVKIDATDIERLVERGRREAVQRKPAVIENQGATS
jgi:excisionase family DNA binding protein